jgi:predicted branched-subunit amino acid permease
MRDQPRSRDQPRTDSNEISPSPLRETRRGRLIRDSAPIAISVAGNGLVFGMAAQAVGLSLLEASL